MPVSPDNSPGSTDRPAAPTSGNQPSAGPAANENSANPASTPRSAPAAPSALDAAARRTDFDSLRPAGRRCLACGVEPEAGQTLNAVLIELPRRPAGPAAANSAGGQFQRLDYCPDCWAKSPWPLGERLLDEGQSANGADLYGAAPVAMWSARVAPRERPRRSFLDDTVLTNFFLRLADDPDPVRQRFRFVLMLALMRHRKLRHERTDRAGQVEGIDQPGRTDQIGQVERAVRPARTERAGRSPGPESSAPASPAPAPSAPESSAPAPSAPAPSAPAPPGPESSAAARDVWLVRLSPAMAQATGTSPDVVYPVIDPGLDESQVQQVAEQLSQILHEDIDAAG